MEGFEDDEDSKLQHKFEADRNNSGNEIENLFGLFRIKKRGMCHMCLLDSVAVGMSIRCQGLWGFNDIAILAECLDLGQGLFDESASEEKA